MSNQPATHTPQPTTNLPYEIAFSVFPGIGPVRYKLLLSYFGTPKSAWNANQEDLESVGLPKTIMTQFVSFRQRFDIEDYLKQLQFKHIRAIPISDRAYPERLRQIVDAPIVLYVYGEAPLSLLNQPRMIAVVGTRSITPYGKEATKRIVRELVQYRFTITSGLALGVDGVAHSETLAGGGKTIAVLGCGVDIIAPGSHAALYYDIAKKGGLIVSEMPLTHRPLKGLFPARNRIISGLSLGVIVTEGAENSGALITARYAAEQGREVFAVPGPITSRYSRGPAQLLKNGATVAENAEDILHQFNMIPGNQSKKGLPDATSRSQLEQKILRIVAGTSSSADKLVCAVGADTVQVLTALTALEMAGYIEQTSDGEYTLTSA